MDKKSKASKHFPVDKQTMFTDEEDEPIKVVVFDVCITDGQGYVSI